MGVGVVICRCVFLDYRMLEYDLFSGIMHYYVVFYCIELIVVYVLLLYPIEL